MFIFFVSGFGTHRDLHVLTHSFPTRRSSDLAPVSAMMRRLPMRRASSACASALLILCAPVWLRSSRLSQTCAPTRSEKRGASVSGVGRSEEHTSELQSLMRISYAVFCLKKKNHTNHRSNDHMRLDTEI